ncbi:1,3-beta-glucanase [Vibrio sinensis]|uniref:Beta-glucanase n=2 Tax=Vibrio sinensis TaxID=2302434 RepID=A0A3A6QQT2_9VIBR|nr:1,3-beta-glucanase [Vibrio sinensis]
MPLIAVSFSAGLYTPTVVADSVNDPLTELDPQMWWLSDGWENGFPFLSRWEASAVSFGQRGMKIKLKRDRVKRDQPATFYSGELRSQHYYSYGCYEIDMKPISEPGVVSSFFLFAGPYDTPEGGNGKHNEIDIEFLGSNTNMVQLNFWTDDDGYTNTHESLVFLDFDASQSFHRYGIYWSKSGIEWFIDGKSIFKVRNNPVDPTPSADSSKLRVMANVWATNPDIANWAGEFDISKRETYRAKYRNFSFTPDTSCINKPL